LASLRVSFPPTSPLSRRGGNNTISLLCVCLVVGGERRQSVKREHHQQQQTTQSAAVLVCLRACVLFCCCDSLFLQWWCLKREIDQTEVLCIVYTLEIILPEQECTTICERFRRSVPQQSYNINTIRYSSLLLLLLLSRNSLHRSIFLLHLVSSGLLATPLEQRKIHHLAA
jgi:hypothetical protein